MRTLGGIVAFLLWLGGWAFERRRSGGRRSAPDSDGAGRGRSRWLRGGLSLMSAVLVTLLGVWLTSLVDDSRSRREESSADRRQLEQLLAQATLVGVDFRDYDLTDYALIDRDITDALLDDVPLVRATLRGVTADGANLSGADLRSATVRSSSLAAADLRDVQLNNTVIAEVGLTDADLTGADLSGATAFDLDLDQSTAEQIEGTSLLLVDASATESQWTGANLGGSVLLGVDLRDTVLDEADLSGAQLLPHFDDAARPLDAAMLDLTEDDIASAFGLSSTDFGRLLEEAGLTVANLVDVRPSSFVQDLMVASLQLDISLHSVDVAEMLRVTGFSADEFTVQPLFQGTSLREADLSDIDFMEQSIVSADLTGSVVQGADLAGVAVEGSSLAGVDLGGAQSVDSLDLTSVRAQSSVWSGRTYTGIRLSDVDLDYADLRETEFVDSSFSDVSLRGADLRGADLSSVTADGLELGEICFDADTRLPAGAQPPAEATCYDRPPVPRRSTNEPTETAPSETDPIEAVRCGDHTCYGLQVFDTFENGRDEGLYIRSCPGPKAECPRPIALAALDDVVWAYCKVDDGLDVEGNSTWVRVTWDIVPDAVPADGRVAAGDTGYSSPTATGRGWATTRYLRDVETVDRLPSCDVGQREG